MRPIAAASATLLALAVLASDGAAQTAADSAAIRATALDYAEGWYSGDAARMQRSLHPDLAKRIVSRNGGGHTLQQMSATQLVDATRGGSGRSTPAPQQQKDVRILDIFGNTASVRLTMNGWVDYMHVAKWEDRWVIVNVLWEMKQR